MMSQIHAVREVHSFGEFIRTRLETVIIHDRQLEKEDIHARAQLRSVPLLTDFGFETFVYTGLWDNKLDLVKHTHVTPESVESGEEDVSFPLVYIVTQEGIDEHGEEPVVWELFQRSLEESGWFVLVCDTSSPRVRTHVEKPGKGLDELSPTVTVKNYEEQFNEYVKRYVDSPLPMRQTRNAFYHWAAAYHKQRGQPPTTLEELFTYSDAPIDSPIWDPLYYFIEEDMEGVAEGHSEYIRGTLRSWTEWGATQKIASSMFDLLDRMDFDRDRLEAYQERQPEQR